MTSPAGRVVVTTQARNVSRLEVLGFGKDDRIINPGDLLIVSSSSLSTDLTNAVTEFALSLSGRDLPYFIEAAQSAYRLYKANEEWLNAPISGAGDTGAGINEVPDRMQEIIDRVRRIS